MRKNIIKLILILNRMNLIYLSDKTFLKTLYLYRTGKNLNLKEPKTFNEKLQWLKLYDRKDIYTTMVDKYEAKKYVSNIIGEKHIIPTLGIYDKFNDITFNKLPNQFVIKCTHDSGGLAIIKNKEKINLNKIKAKINKCLKNNFYYSGREWPYKNVKPRIIIEKYMEDNKGESIKDYKFFCFNGEPKIMYISDNSHTSNQRIAFFDMNYKPLDIKRTDYLNFNLPPEKPKNFEKMKEYAKLLSKDIPHIRIDFYEINSNLYFSELTFFTCSGMIPFENDDWDKKLGQMLDLSMVKRNEK